MRIVVLGTGTSVGKTWLTQDLAKGLGARHCPVLALKPVETGFPLADDRGPVAGSDAAQLESVMFHVQHPRPHPLYALPEGLSPHLAAERHGRHIELGAIESWISEAERAPGQRPFASLIETAGGVFSPLSLQATNYDLALALGASLWLLVAPDRLGVLHDVAATVSAMCSRGRGPDLLALLPPSTVDASTGSNLRELKRLHPELTVVAHRPASESAPRTDSELLSAVRARLSR
ncbi:MAG TPA: dethiobiotin synthase [Polyangiaceae bacterium]|nr:dethiobiotin synthase [Polyangiaceae bacterium]